MNIYDISRLAGVSIATVSRVLNGSDKVSDATRQKVLDIMERNGYTPNAFARGLGLNTMRTVGILCADSSDIYLAKVIYLLEREGYVLNAEGTAYIRRNSQEFHFEHTAPRAEPGVTMS